MQEDKLNHKTFAGESKTIVRERKAILTNIFFDPDFLGALYNPP